MPATPNEWAEGFLREARVDFEVAATLHQSWDLGQLGAADSTPAQRNVLPAAVAQYLQCMEKALKAMYLAETQTDQVRKHEMLEFIFASGPKSLKDTIKAQFGRLLDKALELERLSPTSDASAVDTEYPSYDPESQTVLIPGERITLSHLSGAKRCATLALKMAHDRLNWVRMT